MSEHQGGICVVFIPHSGTEVQYTHSLIPVNELLTYISVLGIVDDVEGDTGNGDRYGDRPDTR